MTENERIKQLRKEHLQLTLEEFGAKLGLGKSSISDIETGRRNITPQTRISICREYNVREEWLKDGEGTPCRVPGSRDEEIMAFVGEALADESADFRVQLLHVLSRLTEQQWDTLADIAELLRSEAGPDPPQ